MNKFITILVLFLLFFSYPKQSFSEDFKTGTVGWYMTSLDRNSKDLLILGIIKGMRFSEYYHQFAISENSGSCTASMPKYPKNSDYAHIITQTEKYIISNRNIWKTTLVEDVVALIFTKLQ